MSMIKIGDREIGGSAPTFIIAEGCDNHLGNMATAREMIVQAKLAGADCIKFQHHLPDEEMLPDVPMSANFDEPLYEFLKKYALTLDQHAELQAMCKEVGIQYLCTPFSYKAACELNEIGVDAFKIGSGEMTDVPSLEAIARLGKPMIVSTGMCTLDEIERTYRALRALDTPLALTNCVSEYPPVYEDINIGVVQTMTQRFPEAVIGHSDHTPDIYTCFAAVTLGAKIIEKHIILDKRQPGPDQSVSIDMRDLANLVDGIRKVEVALGTEKKVHDREAIIREWAFRSIVTTQAIPAGTVLAEGMLWTKRPGTGIPSHRLPEMFGKRTVRELPANVLLKETDVE